MIAYGVPKKRIERSIYTPAALVNGTHSEYAVPLIVTWMLLLIALRLRVAA